MTKVMIGAPVYGGLADVEFVSALVQTALDAQHLGVSVVWPIISHESLITRARNYILNQFLASNCTHLFFIDSDIGWRSEDFFRVVNSPHELTCGAYPKKGGTPPYEYVFNPKGPDAVIKDGYVEVHDAGTGFMCLKRSAVEKLVEKHQDRVYNGQGVQKDKMPFLIEVFRTEIHDDIYLSEDYMLCKDARDLGIPVMIDVRCELSHSGRQTFKGSFVRDFLEKK